MISIQVIINAGIDILGWPETVHVIIQVVVEKVKITASQGMRVHDVKQLDFDDLAAQAISLVGGNGDRDA